MWAKQRSLVTEAAVASIKAMKDKVREGCSYPEEKIAFDLGVDERGRCETGAIGNTTGGGRKRKV